MPLDASIYGQYLKPPKSVDEYAADADAREANKLQLIMQRAQVGDKLQAAERNRSLLQTLQGATTEDDVAGIYQRFGMPEQADKVRKSSLERDKLRTDVGKTTAETGKLNYGLTEEKRKSALSQITAFRSPSDALAALDLKVQNGEIEPQMGEILKRSVPADAAQFPRWQAQMAASAADPSKLIDLLTPHLQTNNTGGATVTQAIDKVTGLPVASSQIKNTQSPDNAASNATTMRGQNMVDARARESAINALTKPFEVTGPDGVPILVQQDKQGNLRRVEGFGPKAGTSKPMTEGQAKANLFGTRMQEAEQVFTAMEQAGETRPGAIKSLAQGVAGAVPIIGDSLAAGAGALTNFTQSSNQQAVEQARRDFINAVLRRESGAAIAASEFANADQQYFPQMGDTKATIEQKRRNRQTAIQGVLAEVPAGSRIKPAVATQPAAPAAAAPITGTTIEDIQRQLRGDDLLKAADAIVGGK